MTRIKLSLIVALIATLQWSQITSAAEESKKPTATGQKIKLKSSDKNEEKLHTASQSLFGYNNNNGLYSGGAGGFSGVGGGYSPGFGGQGTSGFLPNYSGTGGAGGFTTNSLGGSSGGITSGGFSGLGQSGFGQGGGFSYPGGFGGAGSSGFGGVGSSGFGGVGSSGFGSSGFGGVGSSGFGSSGFGSNPSYLSGGQGGYFGGAGSQFGNGLGLNYPQFGFSQQGQQGFYQGQQDRNLGFVNQAFGNPLYNRSPAVSNVQPGLGSLQVGNRIDVNSANRGINYRPSGGVGGFAVAGQRGQTGIYPGGFGQQFGIGGANGGFNSIAAMYPGAAQGGIYSQNPAGVYPSQLDYFNRGGVGLPLRSGGGAAGAGGSSSSTPQRIGGSVGGTRLQSTGPNRFYQGTNPAGAFQRGDRIHRFTSSNEETTK